MKKSNFSLKEKRIICLRGVSNIGKTETIKALAIKLLARKNKDVKWYYPETSPIKDTDLWKYTDIDVEIIHNSNHIGLSSRGDCEKLIKQSISRCIKNGCNIIFCTCRGKGKGMEYLKKVVASNGYSLIFTSPLTIGTKHNEDDEIVMNNKMADFLSLSDLMCK